ncbi:MAG TPA: YdjY domain-containing protein [Thermoanaerobaculia bacterium]|nr:YdjY domain-containing protein [Thermoanaerobaculia bacterium]
MAGRATAAVCGGLLAVGLAATAALVSPGAGGLAACVVSGPAPPAAAVVVRRGPPAPPEIEFPATVAAAGFDGNLFMPGYHAVVWRGGNAAGAALLRAEVTDVQLLDALESLGAKPGNTLGMPTWEERHDPASPAPDQRIAGPAVEALVRLPGRPQLLPLPDLLEDPGGRGLDLRFGGHRANIPRWHSGCLVCLYSCPGSKVGNNAYTVRDYVNHATRFRARRDLLPKDGTRVGVILRLKRG